jgi:AcrR family transcriptional regulator
MANLPPATTTGVPREGLRAWKKERTRTTIADVATELFVRDGFEAVTVAQIAQAAEVSVKTVFNYFPSKEDLFYDRADEMLGALAAVIIDRPATTTVLGALHRALAEQPIPFGDLSWHGLREPESYERVRRFLETAEASPALRTRRLAIGELWSVRLTQLIASQLELPAGDPRAAAMAAMVNAAMTLRAKTMTAAILERLSARTVERRVRSVVDEAFTRLARAYEDIDVPRAIPNGHG